MSQDILENVPSATRQPKVSVIMGIFNCEKTLADAIESIIAQTYKNWELIMFDDGSTDGTRTVAQKYADQYPSQIILLKNEENMKLSYALNRCLAVATGELIARQDGDDRSCPERLQREVDWLLAHPQRHVVGCDMRRFDDKGFHNVMRAPQNPDQTTLARVKTPFFHATIVAWKYVFDELGGYTVSKRALRIEDVELWFRFFHRGFKGGNISEPLYEVREDYEVLTRRTIRDRFNSFMVLRDGFRLLNFPRRLLIKPALLAVAKSLIPVSVVRFIRRRQGALG